MRLIYTRLLISGALLAAMLLGASATHATRAADAAPNAIDADR